MKSLIAFVVAHSKACDCHQCKDLGGIENLFDIYLPEAFPDKDLRKIWTWLKVKYKQGSCQFEDLDFTNDPTAPKLSDIVHCSNESMVLNLEDPKNRKYLSLSEILCNT